MLPKRMELTRLYCCVCNKPMDEIHPGWWIAKMMGWDPGPCERNGWWLNLHSSTWAYEVLETRFPEGAEL